MHEGSPKYFTFESLFDYQPSEIGLEKDYFDDERDLKLSP